MNETLTNYKFYIFFRSLHRKGKARQQPNAQVRDYLAELGPVAPARVGPLAPSLNLGPVAPVC